MGETSKQVRLDKPTHSVVYQLSVATGKSMTELLNKIVFSTNAIVELDNIFGVKRPVSTRPPK